MIILKSCGSPSWGGIEIYILRTASELDKSGHSVSMLCLPESNLHNNTVKRGIRPLPFLRKGTARLAAIFRLSRWLKKNPVDVIHTHLSNDLWILVPAIKLSRKNTRLVLSKCMESGVTKKDMFHRYLYKRVDKLVAVSNFVKANFARTCPVDENEIIVIPDAITLEEFDPAKYDRSTVRKEIGIDNNVFVTGMVGRMSPGKGHEILFEAAEKFMNSGLRDKVRFLVVGAASHGEEEYEKKLMNMVREKKIGQLIQFCGFQTDIPRYLAAMDLLVFPSNEESFGGTLLEAMAMRVPVIASNSGGVPDIVINNETGLLIEKNNAAALAEAIDKLYSDNELRNKFAAAGRKRVEENFEMKANMELFERLYAGEV